MLRIYIIVLSSILSFNVNATSSSERMAIERTALDYIQSQHRTEPDMMERGIDKSLAKRTYWESKDGSEFIMETDFATMVKLAETYNKKGDKFPKTPRVEVEILDIDNRVASVKLIADDWIDYMHMYRNDKNEWKIINVLWQYHDTKLHSNRK